LQRYESSCALSIDSHVSPSIPIFSFLYHFRDSFPSPPANLPVHPVFSSQIFCHYHCVFNLFFPYTQYVKKNMMVFSLYLLSSISCFICPLQYDFMFCCPRHLNHPPQKSHFCYLQLSFIFVFTPHIRNISLILHLPAPPVF
jgi:hypothetical protein